MSSKLFTFTDADLPTTMTRTPILPAQIVQYESGLEQRNRVRLFARFRLDLRWQFPLSEVTVNSVANFYLEHGGNFETFLFLPPVDSDITTGQVIGRGNGARTLLKVLGNRYGSAQVFVDGSSVSATYSTGNGTITFTAAPASGTLLTANVTSHRYVTRFQDPEINHPFFLWKLVENQTITLIQDGGIV